MHIWSHHRTIWYRILYSSHYGNLQCPTRTPTYTFQLLLLLDVFLFVDVVVMISTITYFSFAALLFVLNYFYIWNKYSRITRIWIVSLPTWLICLLAKWASFEHENDTNNSLNYSSSFFLSFFPPFSLFLVFIRVPCDSRWRQGMTQSANLLNSRTTCKNPPLDENAVFQCWSTDGQLRKPQSLTFIPVPPPSSSSSGSFQ